MFIIMDLLLIVLVLMSGSILLLSFMVLEFGVLLYLVYE